MGSALDTRTHTRTRTLLQLWPVAVVVAAFVGIGGVKLARRAGSGEAAAAVQARLDAVPTTIGDWTSQPQPLPPKQLAGSEAVAHLGRVYRSPGGGAVSVLVLAGDPGPLGAHDPQTCFPGAGYTVVSRPVRKSVPGRDATFWEQRFATADVPPATVQVVWGWGADGRWEAADAARLAFADRPQIYKLYASRYLPPTGNPDLLTEFLTAFLPALDQPAR